jgi:hypothetical protein
MGGYNKMTEELKPNPNTELIELMRQREVRDAREYERVEAERATAKEEHGRRVEVRKAGDKYYWTELHARQARCDHRKGTSGSGPKAKHIDYDVSRHVFANGVTQIKCLKCKHKSLPGDTKALCHGSMDSYVLNLKSKKGPHLPNPTKLSYADWYNMTLEENTTNRETRAEIITKAPEMPILTEA